MIFINHQNIFIFLFIIILNNTIEEEELRWAFEIFRHGARTPYSGMNKDFQDCFGTQWNGVKELTGVGLRQHFLVGYRNRIRYMEENHLINNIYDPREVYLISTDTNRTIMSANAQVQGLFLPGTGSNLTENQSNVAIPPVEEGIYREEKQFLDEHEYATLPNRINIMPIHTFFNQEHFIQLQDKKNCPKAGKYYDENQNREEVKQFLEKMNIKYGANLKDLLINEEDKVDNVLKNYTKAYYIFDTIISQYTEGKEAFQKIVNKLGVDQNELLEDCFKFFDLDLIGKGKNNDSELCLHSMSPIFDRLIKWMDDKIDKDNKGYLNYTEYDLPKFVMFSAHDSTCGAFMGFMNAIFGSEIKYPYFATNINLELIIESGKEKKKENYKVRYIINDENIETINYNDFVTEINKKKKSTDDINKFCGFVEEKKDENIDGNKSNTSVYVIVNVILSIISIILIILIFVTINKKKNSKSGEIEDINNFEPLGAVKGNEND